MPKNYRHDTWHGITHPDPKNVDVCVYPFDTQRHDVNDELDISSVVALGDKQQSLESGAGLSLGDEVFITGAFVGRIGENRNIPVARIGHIAAMPQEPVFGGSPRHPAYLIETKSLGGISGSPVFLNTVPYRRSRPIGMEKAGEKSLHAPYLLIGMMHGIHGENYHFDFVTADDHDQIIPADTEFNAGIGIALPIDRVYETLNHPSLVEGRRAAIEAKKRDSGYRPA
jgi:hypothetical protein